MADSTILNLDLQTTGSNSGTWGTVTNENLEKMENAVKGAISGIFAATGQTCIAGSLLLVQKSIHSQLLHQEVPDYISLSQHDIHTIPAV